MRLTENALIAQADDAPFVEDEIVPRLEAVDGVAGV